ncbi:hypothetical protein [Parablautia muri]|uniref:Uncharacterized protein n=1 Tax=Parablautia muri TaxID=2320879 RepID=A0A9X5BH67_9FIRM|nr:hypothetical protein [Parablautia muri]NBJ94036.1 hypothetical protein [Parablautia muri]
MKRLIALALAGAMVFSLPVMAATSPSASAVVASSSSKAKAAAADTSDTVEGVPSSVVSAAASVGMSVGEYMNNAVVSVPGLDSVTPIGQGGHILINGAPSNVTFNLSKPVLAAVNSAKAQAAALGGKVLNVVKVSSHIGGFNTAQVNYYMKGVKTGQLVKVYQLVNGQWVELTVAEIRDDHVVVDMTSFGTLAFIEVPGAVAPAAE